VSQFYMPWPGLYLDPKYSTHITFGIDTCVSLSH